MENTMTSELPKPAAVSSMPWLGRIVCGDNVEVLWEWPSETVDMILTSPPYDDLRKYGGHLWDFEKLAQHLTRVLKPGGVMVWNTADATVDGSETGTSMRQALAFMGYGLKLWDTMIWDKDCVTTPTESRYYSAWEYMFVLSKGKPNALNLLCDRQNREPGRIRKDLMARCSAEGRAANTGKTHVTPESSRRLNVWRVNPSQDAVDVRHPAVMPLAIASAHIQSWSNPGDMVLDPFAGSGTTLKAAKELNRRWCGIEINPEYVKIAEARLSQDVLQLETCAMRPNNQAERQP